MAAGAPLTERALAAGVRALARRDPDLAAIVESHGRPPLWSRPPGFATLVWIILEQQVSIASARAAFERLTAALGEVAPAAFLGLDEADLKRVGFSRQKARYCRSLAAALGEGRLDLDEIAGMPDGVARSALVSLDGVGPWTADIYLLMALGRRDVWPAGDLALAEAARRIKRLDERPGPDELARLAEPWRPWRAVAARLLWHFYLAGDRGD